MFFVNLSVPSAANYKWRWISQTRKLLLPKRILLVYKNVTSDDHVVTFASDKPFVLVDTEQMGLEKNTKLTEKRIFKNKW